MASNETTDFNKPHKPASNAIEAFERVQKELKAEIVRSRNHWDKHEARMWKAVKHLRDEQLVSFDLSRDLVLVSSSPVSYGVIILGKIKVPGIDGYIHARIHDSPEKGTGDVTFHSIWTDEGPKDENDRHVHWKAIQSLDEPLVLFHE